MLENTVAQSAIICDLIEIVEERRGSQGCAKIGYSEMW
jgi:hypothetical protein